jgi:hypothetical protein
MAVEQRGARNLASQNRGLWQGIRNVSGMFLILGCGAVGLASCSGGDIKTQNQPQISVLIDGLKAADNVCSHFSQDDTNGVIHQSKKLTITNTGALGTLCINKITFTASSTKLMTIAYGPHPLDPSACPGAFASLEPGKSMVATISYAPSSGVKDNVTLSIEHNDADPTKYNNMCFDVSTAGPIISRKTTELPFINPKASGGTPQCAYFGNDGDAPLVITALAELSPQSPEYVIVSQPNIGDQINALGSADNQPINPKTLSICVVMKSDGNPDNDEVQLIIHTNDPVTPNATVKLYSKFENASSYTITCQGADTSVIEFNFQGAGAGTTRCCNVHNDGPTPWAWNNPPSIDAIAPSLQADVDAVYVLDIQRNGQPRAPGLWGAGAVPQGQSVDYCITYTPPTNGQPPPSAKLGIPYKQDPTGPNTAVIPIVSASCDLPTLEFAPDQVWFYATMNQKAVSHLVFANQSCAPLDVLKACINKNNPSGADPCASPQYLSPYFTLTTSVGASQIAPSAAGAGNGLLGLEVQFLPTDDLHINDLGLLNIVYCITGSASGGDCKPGYQTINLTGNTTAGVTLPSAVLTQDTVSCMSGKPCTIGGALTIGSFPSGNTWNWQLIARPAGSKAWIGGASQSTVDPSVTFVPDAPGEYKIQGAALTIDATTPSNIAWTPPATVTVTVTAPPKP